MARKVQAASIPVPIQARRQKLTPAENGKVNENPTGRKSKLTDSAMPAAAAPGRQTGRPAKALGRLSAKDAKPAKAQRAAQWDHATDTVRFDWPAIEQMASRDGPHQGTAKLLIAARAQGANSRWPL